MTAFPDPGGMEPGGAAAADRAAPAGDDEPILPRLARRLLSDGAWAFAGKIATSGGGALVSVLLTRLLSPTDVGAYFLALSIVTVAGLAARAGLEKTALQMVTASLGAGEEARARWAVRRVLTIALATVGLIALVLALGGGRWIAGELFTSQAMVRVGALMAPWMAFLAFEKIIAEAFRGFHDIPRASIYGGAVSRLLCVLGLFALLVWVGQTTLRTVVLVAIGCGVVALIPAASALLRKLRQLRKVGDTALSTADVLRTSWPLLVSNLTLFVTGKADLWIIGAFRSDSEVALYGVAVRLVLLVGVSLTVVNAILPPLIGELYVREDRARLERVVRTTASIAAIPSVVVLAAFIVAGGPILGILFGSFYRDAALVLGLLSVGQLVNVWVGSCGYVLVMTGHERDLMWTAVLSGSISLVGGLITVMRFGIVGVAAAVAIGTITQQILMLWMARRRCRVWTHATPRLLSAPIQHIIGLLRRS